MSMSLLPEQRKSYAFDLSAGLGEIRLNGQSKGAFDAEYETGSNGGAEVELTAGGRYFCFDTAVKEIKNRWFTFFVFMI